MIATILAFAFAITCGIAAIGSRNRGRAEQLPVPVRVLRWHHGVGNR